MKFFPSEFDETVAAIYGITREEYEEIQDKLKEGLSFGACGWCV
jgi:hypothetical protein